MVYVAVCGCGASIKFNTTEALVGTDGVSLTDTQGSVEYKLPIINNVPSKINAVEATRRSSNQ